MYAVYGVSIKPLRKRRPPHPERKKKPIAANIIM